MNFTQVSYNRAKEIPSHIWKELDCVSNTYFHFDYLHSLEENNPHLTFFYIVLKNEQAKSIAFANVQVIDFHIDEMRYDSKSIFKPIVSVGRKLKVLPKEKPLKILNCGNPFVSGEHGVYIHKTQDKKKVLKKLAKGILEYTQDHYQANPIDIFIIKDFIESSLLISNELISLGYYPFNVEPNMKLSLKPTWNSFDDYLGSLKTKFRVKTKRALFLSKDLLVQNVTVENIDNQLKEMSLLYKNVTSKANFNLGEFKMNTYKSLKDKFQESYILKSYSLNGKMVGFMSGLITQKSLDAHFVGIDYQLNRQYAIYQRMLYDYINIAITKKLEIVNFGRTASEIKSSVGAAPEHLTIYIRHKKSITNKFLKLFLLKIRPTEFNQKFPFKSL